MTTRTPAPYLSSNGDCELLAFAGLTLDEAGRSGPLAIVAEHAATESDEFILSEDDTLVALLWNVVGRDELACLDLASDTATHAPASSPAPRFRPRRAHSPYLRLHQQSRDVGQDTAVTVVEHIQRGIEAGECLDFGRRTIGLVHTHGDMHPRL